MNDLDIQIDDEELAPDAPCEMYRHFGADGCLLYVGISTRTVIRLSQHKHCSAWFSEIATITIERFPCRADALAAERETIIRERPKYNKVWRPVEVPSWLTDLIGTGPMASDEVAWCRKALGFTQQGLADELELHSKHGHRTVRHWETDGGKFAITGPARVAIRLMLAASNEMRKGDRHTVAGS